MKIETTVGKNSKYLLARKNYKEWLTVTKEAKIYKAILFALARGKCPTCGEDMILSYNREMNKALNSATLDHTIPLAKTLKHGKYGLEIMCKKCNSEKGGT